MIKSSRGEKTETISRKNERRTATKESVKSSGKGSWSGGWEIERRVTPENMINKEVSANL